MSSPGRPGGNRKSDSAKYEAIFIYICRFPVANAAERLAFEVSVDRLTQVGRQGGLGVSRRGRRHEWTTSIRHRIGHQWTMRRSGGKKFGNAALIAEPFIC